MRRAQLVFVLFLIAALTSGAQARPLGHSNAQELVGAPVLTADGIQVAQVADVSTTIDGRIDAVRVAIESFLGFGERIVTLQRNVFTVSRGSIVLDLPAEALGTLPLNVPDDAPEPR